MTFTWSYFTAFRVLAIAILVSAAIAVVVATHDWPLVGDAQVFHYSHFLMEHGFAPYRDIPDMNLPGCYVVENWAMHLFGGSDLSWRIYDFTLLAVLTLAMIVIARPYDWLAGLFAGVLFTLQHMNNGPWTAVERDEIMTVLTMVAFAFLFEGIRRRRPWLLFAFGASLGMAGTIKPTVTPLGIALLVMAAVQLRKNNQAIARYMIWSLAGAAAAYGYALAFLLQWHALGSFLYDVKTITSSYAATDRAGILSLLHRSLPMLLWTILPFAALAALLKTGRDSWEQWAIGVGVVFGAVSYIAQGKGFQHHKYPLVAAALLWAALELTLALRETETGKWTRPIGIAGIAAGLFIVLPIYLHHIWTIVPQNGFTVALESDLTQMGGKQLDRQVECLDIVYGCFDALYHLNLVQSNGNLGDVLLFAPQRSAAVDQNREWFWHEIMSNPPSVFILSNERFYHSPSFDKLNLWPKFATYLADNYQPVITRTYPQQADDSSYRIYVRRGVSLPLPAGSSSSK